MIYFIQAEIVGRIKIGVSTEESLNRRVESLSTASPVRLRLLATQPGNRRCEQRLHAKFASLRVHGEWFEAGPKLIRYIARLQCPEIQEVQCYGPRRRETAAKWLEALFKDKTEIPATTVFEEAASANPKVSRNSLLEAREKLGIISKQRHSGIGKHWIWLKKIKPVAESPGLCPEFPQIV